MRLNKSSHLDRSPAMLKSAKYLLLLVFVVFVSHRAEAQDLATYTIQSDSKMWIEGTSNKSDWTVNATEMTGFVMTDVNGSVENPGIQKTEIVVPSAKIASNKSSIMDRLMKKALKVQQHSEITYVLKSAEVESSSESGYTLNTMGDLTLAGVTNEIAMSIEGAVEDEGKMRFKGSHTMLMSDFDIDRPTAMYGSLRTGDEVVVHFDLLVARDMEQE